MAQFPDLHLLQTLAVFAETRTVVSVGKELGITQPTVTRHLKQLEDWAPRPLFRRVGRQKILTEYGEALAAQLKIQLKEVERGVVRLQNQFTENPELKIGARQEILQRFFIDGEFPGTLELVPLTGNRIEQDLKLQELDMAVHHVEVDSLEYVSREFFQSKPVVVVPKKFKSQRPSLKEFLKVCAEYPAAQYGNQRNPLRDLLTRHAPGALPRVGLITSDWNAIERSVAEGHFWSVIPDSYAVGQSYHVFESGLERQSFYLMYRKELGSYPWFQSYLRKLLQRK